MQSSSSADTVCGRQSPVTLPLFSQPMPYIKEDDDDNVVTNYPVSLASDRSSTTKSRRRRITGTFCHRTITRWSPLTCAIMMIVVLSIVPFIGCGNCGISFASANAVETVEQQQHADDDSPKKNEVTMTRSGEEASVGTDIDINKPNNYISPSPKVQSLKYKIANKICNSIQQPSHSSLPTKTKKPNPPQMTLSQILRKAGRIGIGGGVPGAIAGVVQVISLMWLRTLTSYQCRYGTTFHQAIITLYRDGGIQRFYRGVGFALVQAPLVRFVSTAANDGVETLLGDLKMTETWGPGRTTVVASVVVGMWRMFLMPIDTCKTVLQVDSVEGFRDLVRKLKAGKVTVLYEGALANVAAAIVSHYPWFYTYNYLSRSQTLLKHIRGNFLRNAAIGFLSSVVSDSISNVVRVIKTTKQTFASKHSVSYGDVVGMIVAADGWMGLFGRGLRTRILGNAVQSVLFTVIWRGLAERRKRRRQSKKEKQHNANLNKEEGTGEKEEASSSSGVSNDDLGDKVIIDELYQY